MPVVTTVNGVQQPTLLSEEERLLCDLMRELNVNDVDFLLTKMVINNWPKADKSLDDIKDGDEKDGDDSVRYMNRLQKCKNCILRDDFCYSYALGYCRDQNKKSCQSYRGFINKHNKSFNIVNLYNNGKSNVTKKRRAYYLSHYLSKYCGYNKSLFLINFNEMILQDKDYNLLKISLSNTSVEKKAKRMRRKLNNKKKSKKGANKSDVSVSASLCAKPNGFQTDEMSETASNTASTSASTSGTISGTSSIATTNVSGIDFY